MQKTIAPAAALLAALLLISAPRAEAQVLPSFGIVGGLNFGSLGDAATANLDEAVGYHIGAFGDMGFGLFGIRTSVMYVRAGNIAFPSALPVLGDETSVEFIAIPIDLKYGAGLPLVNPYVLVGPELRFPLGGISEDPDAKSTVWAINLGAGADIGTVIGPRLFAELRYAFDMTGFVDRDESIRVSLFYLRLGIGL